LAWESGSTGIASERRRIHPDVAAVRQWDHVEAIAVEVVRNDLG
jgi:hypothetical protein